MTSVLSARASTVKNFMASSRAASRGITSLRPFPGPRGVSIVLPYGFLDTSSGPFRASANGASDIGFLWQMNIFGGPALTREQFQPFIPQTFSSFHLLVTPPLGTYNPTLPINPSANRWMVSPTVDFSYTPDEAGRGLKPMSRGDFSPITTTIALTARRRFPRSRAYACNNRHYVNSSGHVVHSPSWGREHLRQTAVRCGGSVSFSEHRRGTCSHHHAVGQ